jgi:4-hydroxy-3-polyprenylbenzoate decarboxylase
MRIIVGITGASGVIYGIRLLEELKKLQVESHLVISKWGRKTIILETEYTIEQVINLASVYHDENNLAAPISSGSFKSDGMVIAPCSMKTLAGIRHGYAENLINRAADVMLKEKRRLILVPRETPLNSVHLENLFKLSEMGVIIIPPVPAFYTKPKTIKDIVDQTVGRILDQFGLETDIVKRWEGS